MRISSWPLKETLFELGPFRGEACKGAYHSKFTQGRALKALTLDLCIYGSRVETDRQFGTAVVAT